MHLFDPDTNTVFLKYVSVNTQREEIFEKLKPIEGFLSLQMSRPIASKNYDRLAWAVFKSDHEC
jgi:hypothetical protein